MTLHSRFFVKEILAVVFIGWVFSFSMNVFCCMASVTQIYLAIFSCCVVEFVDAIDVFRFVVQGVSFIDCSVRLMLER